MTLPLPTGPTRLILPALALWVALPFTTGELIGEALSAAPDPFRTTVSIAAWVLWGAVLVTIAVAHRAARVRHGVRAAPTSCRCRCDRQSSWRRRRRR